MRADRVGGDVGWPPTRATTPGGSGPLRGRRRRAAVAAAAREPAARGQPRPAPPGARAPALPPARSRRPSARPEQLGRGAQREPADDEQVDGLEVLAVAERADPEARRRAAAESRRSTAKTSSARATAASLPALGPRRGRGALRLPRPQRRDHRPRDRRRHQEEEGPHHGRGQPARRSAAAALAPRRGDDARGRDHGHRAGERDRLRDQGAVRIAHPEGERQVERARAATPQRRDRRRQRGGSAARGRSSGASGSAGTASARGPQRSLHESAKTPQAMAPKTPRMGSSAERVDGAARRRARWPPASAAKSEMPRWRPARGLCARERAGRPSPAPSGGDGEQRRRGRDAPRPKPEGASVDRPGDERPPRWWAARAPRAARPRGARAPGARPPASAPAVGPCAASSGARRRHGYAVCRRSRAGVDDLGVARVGLARRAAPRPASRATSSPSFFHRPLSKRWLGRTLPSAASMLRRAPGQRSSSSASRPARSPCAAGSPASRRDRRG